MRFLLYIACLQCGQASHHICDVRHLKRLLVVRWLFAFIFKFGIVEGWHVLEGAHVDRVINHARVAAASAVVGAHLQAVQNKLVLAPFLNLLDPLDGLHFKTTRSSAC